MFCSYFLPFSSRVTNALSVFFYNDKGIVFGKMLWHEMAFLSRYTLNPHSFILLVHNDMQVQLGQK